ncbi:MAG TPA: CoB--CoM heterodisulfide reductase iron-sulfur subunit B family protein [Thermodesulfobacteriota bacterium]|nr:CoB--CoM heterodisulfide reductase iron-sulfur subunit B family protein [Thermodesulfobacteriota bacterium]
MKVSYYPGCALHGTGREYDESTKAVSGILGVELCELPDWNCCGASSAHASDKTLALGLVHRNLAIAKKAARDVVIPCAACYSRFKAGEREEAGENPGNANFRILSLPDFLSDPDLGKKIADMKKRPLRGLKLACYYGCLLVRPPTVTGAGNYENPESMDRLLRNLGAEVVPWSYKTDCCGGSLALTRTDIVLQLTRKLLDKAAEAGAEALAVACPLCQSNLDTRQEDISAAAGRKYETPIFYFTELIALSLGHGDVRKWLGRHLVDPIGILSSKGLI